MRTRPASFLAAALLLACGGPDARTELSDYFALAPPAPASARLSDAVEPGPGEGALRRFADAELARSSGIRVRDLFAGPMGEGGPDPDEPVVMAGAYEETARRFFSADEAALDSPRWPSLFFQVSAAGGGRLFTALNLFYPIHVYDENGALLERLGTPPASWQQAPESARGAPPSEESEAPYESLPSFTMITGLAVLADSVLVVSHGAFEPSGAAPRRIEHTTLDVYVNGERVLTEVPSPGEIIAYARTSVFFLTDASPGSGRNVVEYAWRP